MYHKRLFFLILTSFVVGYRCQDIVFQQEIEDESRLPESGAFPLMNTVMCEENELLYPGDNPGDWVCDCKPGHIYFQNKCHPAYEQGPCKKNFVVKLRKNSRIARCRRNKCPKGEMIYMNRCIKLGGPCHQDNTRFYGVNETTLKLECLRPKFTISSRFSNDRDVSDCVLGSKRHIKGLCSPTVD